MPAMIDVCDNVGQNFSTTFMEFLGEIAKFIELEFAKNTNEMGVEILLVDSDEMRAINKEYRGKDSPTDTLSFPLVDCNLRGSVVINIPLALQMWEKISKKIPYALEDEVAILFIHSYLHLIGMDHELDSGEQLEAEEIIALKFGLPTTLITRANEL